MQISKQQAPLTILGIDPGFADMGYGVISAAKIISYVECGVIKSARSESFPQRLLTIEKQLIRLIKKHKPHLIALEKIFFYKNVTTAIDVAQARGVALLAAARAGITIAEYTPLEVKMSLTSYGHAPKHQVGSMVKMILKLKSLPPQDDAVDALAIAICAHFRKKM